MSKREWQAGDLVRIGSDWTTLQMDDEGDLWADIGEGCTFHGDTALNEVIAKLLAAADADLWDALRGLPGAEYSNGMAILGSESLSIPLCGGYNAHYSDDVIQLSLYNGPMAIKDTAPLEQAIQRFKAIKQYVEVRNGNV